jgi:glycosyltransferase involved in cell wall biosynthesis
VRRILLHAYHFPPTGGSGAQRPARIARHLPEFGYEPVVVTAPRPTGERWTPTDASLGSEVPASTIIRRIPGPEPASSKGWRLRAERWLRLREPWSHSWIKSSTAVGIEAARETNVDLVYAWMQPYSSAEAAARIAAAIDRPWVADLGDPWALDEMMIYPTTFHRRLEQRLMRRALASADGIVMSTPEAKSRLLDAFPEFADEVVAVIPNGFETSDFSAPVPPRTDDAFRIVHTGYLHTDLGQRQRRSAAVSRVLGGAVPGVDILTRSHVFLLEAVERVRRGHPEICEHLEVHFAGVLSEQDLAVARRSPAARTLGFMPHAESLQLMQSADLLFLPMHDLPDGVRATVVPGKTYEYLASGRPILAAVPDGDARDLLAAAGNALLCRPSDVDGIAAAIVKAYKRSRSGEETPRPPSELLERYAYHHLARDLGGVFDQVLGSSIPAAFAAAI